MRDRGGAIAVGGHRVTSLLRVDQRRILRDGDLLGRTLDTYVAAQLRAECSLSLIGADLFHLRVACWDIFGKAVGRPVVDLIGGRLADDMPLYKIDERGREIWIEVKATAAPSRADARHLEWCAQRLGPAFATGLVIYTGPRVIRLTDRIAAVPMAALWS